MSKARPVWHPQQSSKAIYLAFFDSINLLQVLKLATLSLFTITSIFTRYKMAHPSPWAAPLRAFLSAAPAIFPGQTYQQMPYQGAYNVPPDHQQPLHQFQHSAYSPSAHYHQPTSYSCSYKSKPGQASFHLRKSGDKLCRYIKLLTLLSTILSTLLSLVMEGAMMYMTYTFYHTRHHAPAYGDRSGPWAKNTKLWPTCVLLGASAVTSILNLGMLVVTCCKSRKKAVFSMLYNSIHVLLWASVTVAYRLGRTGNDLWGWSCSDKADAVQDLFKGVVNFEGLCKLQVCSSAQNLEDACSLKPRHPRGRHP